MGYGLKKVLRFIIIAVGAIAGVFFIALALMQKHGYISNIKWDAMANDLYTSANTTLTNFHMSNIHEAVNSGNGIARFRRFGLRFGNGIFAWVRRCWS